MNKQKFYIIIIAVLVLINLTFMLLFFNQNKLPHHKGHKNMIIEALGFDDEQIEQYNLLITDHKHLMHKIDNELHDLRESYFLTTTDSSSILLSNSYMHVESVNKNHINDIMELCNSSQKEEFIILIKEKSLFFGRKK